MYLQRQWSYGDDNSGKMKGLTRVAALDPHGSKIVDAQSPTPQLWGGMYNKQ